MHPPHSRGEFVMTETREELKEKLAEMIRILAAGEILTLMKGHLSYRLPGTGEILILGHTHRSGKTLAGTTGADIVTIDLDGNLLDGSIHPPGEKFIHTCIYRKREDVGAVIHAHPHASMAFAVAGVQIIPVHHEAIALTPCVEILDYAGQIDTEETGMMVAEALKDRAALLLRGHGNVVVGSDPEEACCNAFELELNAKIQFQASLLGTPKAITREELQKAPKPGQKPHRSASPWPYYRERYGRNGRQ
jgi:L-fuculose-phosphate aldolase